MANLCACVCVCVRVFILDMCMCVFDVSVSYGKKAADERVQLSICACMRRLVCVFGQRGERHSEVSRVLLICDWASRGHLTLQQPKV